MGQDPSTGSQAVTGTPDPEQLRSEIEETREQLGDTVETLARKADVKAQAKRKVAEVKASATEKKEQALGKAKEVSPDGTASAAAAASHKARENPIPLATVGAFAAGFLVGRLAKR